MINFDFQIFKMNGIFSVKPLGKLLFLLCLLLIIGGSFKPHPYHVGSVEFNHKGSSGVFEISGKFFMDDLENALQKKYGQSYHFLDGRYKNTLDQALANYSKDNLKLKVNNKFVNVKYVGYEEDHESVNIYLESDPVPTPEKVEVAVSYLYNLFDDQINIIHIIVNKQRKSSKLSYPDRYLFQQF